MAGTLLRRPLLFRDLDELLADVEILRTAGYERAGNWDLAQVCSHLAEWMRFPIDGYPRPPALLRPVFPLLKVTVGRSSLRRILESGTMPAGGPTLRGTVAPAGGDVIAAAGRLREAVARFKAHQGAFRPSPFFGELAPDAAMRLQLVHCAHHLSFLIPRTSDPVVSVAGRDDGPAVRHRE